MNNNTLLLAVQLGLRCLCWSDRDYWNAVVKYSADKSCEQYSLVSNAVWAALFMLE